MKTFSIYTLGCKVNQYESQQIRQFLEDKGLQGVKPDDKPDLFIINTCCVTATASAKSRQYIQRAGKLNPKAVQIICGCLATLQTQELRYKNNNAPHIITDRTGLAAKLQQIIGRTLSEDSSVALPLLTGFKGQTRAFLKVQDGCDGVCSYCIVPKVRPDVQSKPIEDAVTEAKALVSAGHKEIVVTGVNLGTYGHQTVRRTGEQESRGSENLEFRIENEECGNNEKLPYLLTTLAGIPELMRIRVSSLEPGDISEQLLDVFCGHKNIMPHIHLSVQSGSDAILKRMCRQYDAAELWGKIALIKSRLDRPAITCDMIVGFPGEAEEDFQETVELAKWAGFSKMHVFGFSLREGTAAAKMKDRIQPKVVKERAEILRKLGDELGWKFREQFIGETCEVLLEDTKTPSGRCERYFMVQIQGQKGEVRRKKAGITDYADCTDSVDPLLQDQRSRFSGTPANDMRVQAGGRMRKNEIVKVRITAVTPEGAGGEVF